MTREAAPAGLVARWRAEAEAALPSFPPTGTSCTYRGGGCDARALPGRRVCIEHADRLD
jgi:hypothetical protein